SKPDQRDGSPVAAQRQVQGGTIDADPKLRQELMLVQYKINPAFKPAAGPEAEMMKLIGSVPDGLITGVVLTADRKALQKDPGAGAEGGPGGPEPIAQMAFVDHTGVLQFAARPEEAPIIHFDGPLQVALHPGQKLQRGQSSDLAVCIGTPGLGKGTFVV